MSGCISVTNGGIKAQNSEIRDSPLSLSQFQVHRGATDLHFICPKLTQLLGLPRWCSGKESTCQSRRHEFDPWVRKILWRRNCQPTPVFLSGKFHGQRSLAGYRPRDCKESNTIERLSTQPNFKNKT